MPVKSECNLIFSTENFKNAREIKLSGVFFLFLITKNQQRNYILIIYNFLFKNIRIYETIDKVY